MILSSSKKKKESTLDDLKKAFTRIREIGMKLNLKKCTFSVPSGRCLGYLASERGIEANPAKIKVIQDMIEPKKSRSYNDWQVR